MRATHTILKWVGFSGLTSRIVPGSTTALNEEHNAQLGGIDAELPIHTHTDRGGVLQYGRPPQPTKVRGAA